MNDSLEKKLDKIVLRSVALRVDSRKDGKAQISVGRLNPDEDLAIRRAVHECTRGTYTIGPRERFSLLNTRFSELTFSIFMGFDIPNIHDTDLCDITIVKRPDIYELRLSSCVDLYNEARAHNIEFANWF